MRINTNILSLSAQRNLATTTRALARAMEKLASGSRINSARDDAAGLAIGVGLDAQRRGIAQAIRNINDASGFLSTAEGALQTQNDLIQRMRELALQSANGILSTSERAYLDQEFQALFAEVSRITSQTEFNGVRLLDGSFTQKSIQVGTAKGASINFSLSPLELDSGTTSFETVGNQSFTLNTTLTTGSGPRGSDLADFNGDGNLDLLTADGAGGVVSVFMGNGNGTFAARTTLSAPAIDVNSADLNGDGNLDIFTGDGTSLTVSVFLGNGNGTFAARSTISVGGNSVEQVAASDLNNDGILDLMAALDSGTFVFTLGNGNGTFSTVSTRSTTSSNSRGIDSADLNNDGNDDIAVTSAGGMVSVFLGNGNGTFQTVITAVVGPQAQKTEIADFNNDGNLDITVTDVNDGTLSVLLGNGNGTFQTRLTLQIGTTPRAHIAEDLDRDGNVDLVSADDQSNYISVYFGNGNGTFQARVTLATGNRPWSVAAGDLNGDDILDIATANFTGTSSSIFLQGSTTQQLTTALTIDITTQENAEDILEFLDTALASIASSRSDIGAIQSRLEYAASNSRNLLENISASLSQIKDADFATETAEFTRLQILQQAGLSVLSQANSNQRMALKLLQNI